MQLYLRRKHVANRSLKPRLFVDFLRNTRQVSFLWTKQLQHTDGRGVGWGGWGRRGRPLLKFGSYIEEWAEAEARVRWKTLQLLIPPSTCSLSCVCLDVNSDCVRPRLNHTPITLISVHTNPMNRVSKNVAFLNNLINILINWHSLIIYKTAFWI